MQILEALSQPGQLMLCCEYILAYVSKIATAPHLWLRKETALNIQRRQN